jgi:hypothetical protein
MEAAVATGCTIMQSFPSFYKVCFVIGMSWKIFIIGEQSWTLDNNSRARLKTFKYLVGTKLLDHAKLKDSFRPDGRRCISAGRNWRCSSCRWL